MAEACGAEVTYPPDKCPWITRSPVQDKSGVESVRVPDFQATRSTAVMIEGTRLLAERSPVPVAAYMTGPLTFSLQLMPYTKFIAATIRDGELAKALASKSVAIIQAYALALKNAGASIFVICEHDAQLFAPKDFKELSLDFLPGLLDLYPHNILHVCGQVTQHLRANLPALLGLERLNMISVGAEVDLAELKAQLRGKLGLAGNIDHLVLLPHASTTAVDEAARAAIEAGKPNGGFMLAPGCEITADTPPDNVDTLIKAVSKYGWYSR